MYRYVSTAGCKIPAIDNAIISADFGVVNIAVRLKVHFIEQKRGWEVSFEFLNHYSYHRNIDYTENVPDMWLLPEPVIEPVNQDHDT